MISEAGIEETRKMVQERDSCPCFGCRHEAICTTPCFVYRAYENGEIARQDTITNLLKLIER